MWGWTVAAVVVAVLVFGADAQKSKDEESARAWLADYNERAMDVYYRSTLASWNYNTNLTAHNQQLSTEASVAKSIFLSEAAKNTSMWDWRNFADHDTKRQFSKLAIANTANLPEEKVTLLSNIRNEMQMIYSTGQVCDNPTKRNMNSSRCYSLEPDLTRIMASSRNYDELLWAWKGWRDATGRKMKTLYTEFVGLLNEASQMDGFSDQGAYWRSWYEMDGFEDEIERLWNQVKPMYQQLHAYVRRKLMEEYAGESFPSTRQIPAHILGNMWAQSWSNIEPLVRPFKNKTAVDVTSNLIKQGYDALRMFNISNNFFTSLGLLPMPSEFWTESLIEKPTDREVVCHASAWDFYNRKDFRIKQCTQVSQRFLDTIHHEMGHVEYYLQYQNLPVIYRRGANPGKLPCQDTIAFDAELSFEERIKQCTDVTMDYLVTTHHEMGHVQYFLQYKSLPVSYRGGANPGFHEAVGDVMALSVATPEHLKKIGLLETVENDTEADINYLMSQALKKIAFLPFGYLIDQWRWSMYRGATKLDSYNEDWWKLRCKHQGVAPPVTRTDADFDPGSKYHIPGNTPYIRYFVSFILQFQIHEALCKTAHNSTAALHRCDIYKSREAGSKLAKMLKLGSSKKWPDALEQVTGGRSMDAAPMLKYFRPLVDWLKTQNEGHNVTWEEACPDESIVSSSQPGLLGQGPGLVALLTVGLLVAFSFSSSQHWLR